jgi:membrane-associated phospholipid phosphatase
LSSSPCAIETDRIRAPTAATQRFLIPGLAFLGFLALVLVAAPRDAFGWETDVVDAATRTPRPVGAVAQAVMQLGTQPTVLVVALIAFLVARPRDLRWRAAVAVLVAGIVVRLSNAPLKELVSRDRPEGVHLRDTSADGFGFPSGHTAIAFALATALAAYLPARWRWAPFTLAAIVGLARMYVGVHFPLDVLGGALWGVAVGGIVVGLPPFRPAGPERTASGAGPEVHM